MSAGPIRFYVDYISSNAYLAWHALGPIAERADRRVEPVPVLFAGLLDAHGTVGPAEVPAKRMWMGKNNLRKAALLGIPFLPPAVHPFRPLLPLRMSLLPMDDATRTALVGALLRAVWAERKDVSDPSTAAQVAASVGLDGERAVADAGRPEAKQALRDATDAAIAAGVFGVPTLIVDDELFWGYDDLPYLERYLAGDDPLARLDLAQWRGLETRRGAWRPGGPPPPDGT